MLPFAFNASSAVSAATMFRQLRQRLQANIFASLSERVLPVLNPGGPASPLAGCSLCPARSQE
jgi:hypothetical protein